MQMRKSFSEDAKKIFIISANSFTSEAQNALLKIFEEPAIDTVFFILISSAQFLLPTLLSRAVVISPYEHEEKFEKIKKFLKEAYVKRLEIVTEIAKDSARTQIFFEEIISFYYRKGKSGDSTKQEIKVLELASKYRVYSYARSPSLKMMLEHLALVCPIQ
jgi:DNA polymerase III delta prime subunit